VHISLAFGKLQMLLQLPQLFTLVLRSTSQPSLWVPLQFCIVPMQLATWQVLALQVSLALGRLQTAPQPPQLLTLEPVSTSQPSAGLPLQSRQVPMHERTPHAPPLQVGLACGRLQAVPQAPQLFTLVLMSTSQPSGCVPLQLRAVPMQLPTSQVPLLQASLALGRSQMVPHVPQLFTLVLVLTSQPSAWSPLQFFVVPMQLLTSQTLLTQVSLALGKLQTVPQRPQFETSVALLTSQPSPGRPLQSRKVPIQACTWQLPLTQSSLALAESQAIPQAPQLFRSELMSTSQPSV